jgi:hypothetical protein
MELNKLIESNKTIVSGVTGGVAVAYMTRGLGSTFVLGTYEVPLWVFGAVLGAGSSLVTDAVSNAVLPHIPQSKKLQRFESIALHLATSAGAFALIPRLLNSNLNNSEMQMFAAAGAVSELASQLVHELTAKVGHDESIF